jgi:type I restriction enzyme S subunit
MNARTLLDNFDLIADAPGGVPKLRELILQLAVRGKLVPQDSKDVSVHVTRSTDTTEPGPKYAIPAKWIWTQLGCVIDYNYGGKTASERIPGDAWLLDLEDIEKDTSLLLQRVLAGDRKSTSTKSQFSAGDVLYGKLRPYLNKVLVANSDGYCTTEIVPMKPLKGVNPHYVVCVLKSRDFLDFTAARSYGMKMPRLGTEDAKRAPFPLPPLPEQKRIVAKVDELMKRCDELESRQKERVAHHKTLVASCLNALSGTKCDPEFIIHHSTFNILFSSPESIAELRKTILQLAVKGQLVAQDPRDEPATVLLRKIAAAKKDLFNAGVIKTSDIKVPIEKMKGRYSVPGNWCWTNIESVSVVGTGSTPSRSNSAYFSSGSIPWVTSSATSAETIDHTDNLITEIAQKETRLRLYPSGTVIVALYGQGKTRGQSSTLGIAATINQACAAIQIPFAVDTIRSYVLLVFKKMYDEIREEAAGGAQPNLNVAKIKAMAVPLPPLAEQKRIVAKVHELMVMCDELEAKLTQSNAVAEKLAKSVVGRVGENENCCCLISIN